VKNSDESEAREGRAPSHAERCRTLVAGAKAASLGTITRDPEGYPYVSLVSVAFDERGRPLFLLSTLAEHTANLAARPEASLLVAETMGEAEALARGRVTLMGRCARVDEPERGAARERFLATHPEASAYESFTDFAFYRLEPVAIRYVGGFGRMSWPALEEYVSAEPDPIAPVAVGILTHMNDDHHDAVLAYARARAKVADASQASMTAVDRYGFELLATTPEGPRAIRLAFDAPVATTDDVRRAMVALVKRARAAAPAGEA